jgi:hypothetical protein
MRIHECLRFQVEDVFIPRVLMDGSGIREVRPSLPVTGYFFVFVPAACVFSMCDTVVVLTHLESWLFHLPSKYRSAAVPKLEGGRRPRTLQRPTKSRDLCTQYLAGPSRQGVPSGTRYGPGPGRALHHMSNLPVTQTYNLTTKNPAISRKGREEMALMFIARVAGYQGRRSASGRWVHTPELGPLTGSAFGLPVVGCNSAATSSCTCVS